jgi:hypothetical protein
MTDPVLAIKTDYGRFYTHPAGSKVKRRKVPSITNVCGVKDKGGGLTSWGQRLCGEYAADNLEALNALAKKDDRRAIIDLVREAPRRSTAASAGVGDVVHSWVERTIKGEEIPPDEFKKPFVLYNDTPQYLTSHGASSARGMFDMFRRIEDRYAIDWIAAEVTVWSEEHEYAGSIDWFANVGDQLVIGDTKTGNKTYKEVAMQIAAGLFADYAFDKNGNQVEIPKATSGGVLHLRPRKGRLEPITDEVGSMHALEEAFQAFLGARQLFEWDVTHQREDVIGVAPWIEK